jgi:hypothetical protein
MKYLTAGSKTVTINYISSSGCTAASATSSTATVVNTLPTVTFTTQPGASACVGSDVTYTTQPSMTSYVWGFPGVLNADYSITSGGTGTSNTVTMKYLTAGSKTVTINYTSSSGCTAASATSSTATTVNACFKTLTLTSVMLEGLYNGGGNMIQARDKFGAHWPTGIADHITVELHSNVLNSYSTVVYKVIDVELTITGSATVIIPDNYNGYYFITIRHRNSIETTTAAAVSFAGSIINQSFASRTNVYGGNLGLSSDGHYLIYGGEVNQDGIVDTGDMNEVDNGSTAILKGYNAADVNGDGIVDTSDMNIVDNNSTAIVKRKLPK